MSDKPIVVIGGGIAGQTLCENLRERDADVPVVLVCAESHYPYDRVQLSDLLVTDGDVSELQLRPEEWYADHDIDIRLGVRVASVDTLTGTVVLEGGEELVYHRLALATGSQPVMPPIPGLDLPGVHPYRDPEHCEAIRQAASGEVGHAAVIGGGLLGLEAARGIQAQGCSVTVVHILDRLMERQLDAQAAGLLLPAMEELGIDVQFDRKTVRVLGTERAEGLEFEGGDRLEADLVVVSVGIRPEKELAELADIDCNRGVLVDDRMRTSAQDVVAIGECAEHRGKVYGVVAPIYEQVKVAAQTLLDREGDEYTGSIPWAKLKVAEIALVSIGEVESERAAATLDSSAREYRRVATTHGRATGAILMGNTRGTEALLEAIRSAEEIEDPLATLAESAQLGPEDLPDKAQVCDCNGVCKGEIVSAVRDHGYTTKQEVMAATRAGTACGSCKPLVAELVTIVGGGSDEPAYLCPCRKQTHDFLAQRIAAEGHQAVSDVADACGTGRECGLCKPALAYLLSEINDNRHREERSARHINDRVHANIQNDGTFSVVPRMHGGVTNSDQLRRIADAADKYQVPMVKVTGAQRIDLLGVKKEDLPGIWADIGMPSGHAYAKAVRQVKSCVGTDFCRFGLGDSTQLGIDMEREWEGLHTPAKIKSGVSGCPRNCAEATVKDIGIVAVEGGWQVRIAGAAGATVREADILATVADRDEALRVATTFLQFYRENAEYKERTYAFVPRVGLEEVKKRVLGEESGARLRERFRIAKTAAAARDPWLEREEPYHPRQFVGLDGEAHPYDGPGHTQARSTEAEEADDAGNDAELLTVGPPEGAEK
jgi:nitrite reductase (NADH) large subunit